VSLDPVYFCAGGRRSEYFMRLVTLFFCLFASVTAHADDWHGNAPLSGGKGYAATPMGQVHYRDVGPRDTAAPFLLLHQTPWTMIEFAEIQNAIAADGTRVITLDTPGYGLSDAPKTQPTIEKYADNLIPVLDALKVKRVIVAGHHTGASVAVALAARHPERVAGLITHGIPLYTAAERAERMSGPHWQRVLKPDGSHLASYYRNILERISSPESPPTAMVNMRNATWAALTMFQQDQDIGHAAAYSYDMEPDLIRVKAPTLVLSDKGDTLAAMDARAVRLCPDFKFRQFSEGKALSLVAEPERWADVVLEFARAVK
jgi:pimeloyl-ACP methyl ester carboxylesterase